MAGNATNRTNITLPPDVAKEIMQKMQEDSAIMKLARKINLPGRGATVHVILGDPTADWVDETDKKPVSNPSVDTKIMAAHKLAVIVPFSNEFRRDADALWEAAVNRLPAALAAKFDATVFTGSAPGSNFDVLSGATQQLLTGNEYGALVAADTDIATNGGNLNGIVLSPQGKGILLAAVDGDSRPLFINNVAQGGIPEILGSKVVINKSAYKAGTPNIVGIAGDWTQAMYGTVAGVEMSISDQSTLDIGGGNSINLWQQNMFAVRAEIEVGFCADANCFNLLTETP